MIGTKYTLPVLRFGDYSYIPNSFNDVQKQEKNYNLSNLKELFLTFVVRWGNFDRLTYLHLLIFQVINSEKALEDVKVIACSIISLSLSLMHRLNQTAFTAF